VRRPANQQAERKRGTTGVNDRNKIKARDNGLCQACKRNGYIRPGDEVDHIKPLCMGGSDHESNKELLCKVCHLKKTAKDFGHEYRPKQTIGIDGWPTAPR
jgi:5-methylcytosine-specific restriction endonuclease McrA